MFLGNLSTTTERKARKGGTSKKSKDEDASELSTSSSLRERPSSSASMVLLPAGELPIIYDANHPDIPKELLSRFFDECSEIINNPISIADIVEQSESKNIPLNVVSAGYQREIMERNFQIENKHGCRELAKVPQKYEDDTELILKGKSFTLATLQCYVSALKFRAEKNGSPRRTSGGMSRNQMAEFFEGCNATMALPETKALLKSIFEQTKAPPNQKIIDLQREMLGVIGLDPDYGVAELNRVGQDYPDDSELHNKMQQFAMCAQLSCREAMMSDEERRDFYDQIPPFMHYFPQNYIQQQQMQHMQHNHGHGHGHGHGHAGSSSSGGGGDQMLRASGMDKIMQTEGGQQMVQLLGERVQLAKTRVEPTVLAMDAEQRQAFFESFQEHPILAELNSTAGDAVEKMKKFVAMSEGDLDTVMTMQLVLGEDIKAGGSLVRTLASSGRGGKGVIGDIFALRSLGAASIDHSHGHGHGHQHGPGCAHYQETTPDVASGKVETMDR